MKKKYKIFKFCQGCIGKWHRVKGNANQVKKKLKELNLPLLAEIPDDEVITEFELKGKPIIDVPNKSKSLLKIKDLAENLFSTIIIE